MPMYQEVYLVTYKMVEYWTNQFITGLMTLSINGWRWKTGRIKPNSKLVKTWWVKPTLLWTAKVSLWLFAILDIIYLVRHNYNTLLSHYFFTFKWYCILHLIKGLDTVASIYMNDHLIASGRDNMFLRYTTPLDKTGVLASPGAKNKLSISFESPVTFSEHEYEKYIEVNGYDVKPDCQITQTECHVNHIRKMQSSFG